MGLLMSRFHHTYAEARRCPLGRAYALRAWAAEHNEFASLDRATDGYIAQEIQRLLTRK